MSKCLVIATFFTVPNRHPSQSHVRQDPKQVVRTMGPTSLYGNQPTHLQSQVLFAQGFGPASEVVQLVQQRDFAFK